ncbi:hypothetical protein DPMN_014539 [Dreissena polymorpha]|uniref:Uncharacterized protein n=1 Tax=Dreissena polymorpha TaxID=45954 RepID=A0A9D4S4S1_DREPO|nr:hypothetical protein DPMN_014539 [Dreissena polymorpha]
MPRKRKKSSTETIQVASQKTKNPRRSKGKMADNGSGVNNPSTSTPKPSGVIHSSQMNGSFLQASQTFNTMNPMTTMSPFTPNNNYSQLFMNPASPGLNNFNPSATPTMMCSQPNTDLTAVKVDRLFIDDREYKPSA